MTTIQKYRLLALVFSVMLSCAPSVQDSENKKPLTPELQTNDVALQQMHKNPFATVGFALKKMGPKKNYTQKNIQNLFEIGQLLKDQNANEKAAFYLNQQESVALKNNKAFAETYYLQLVEEQTKNTLKKSVSEVEKNILADTDRIEKMISDSAEILADQSRPDQSLKEQLALAEDLISNIVDKIQSSDVFSELKIQIPEKLNAEAKSFLANVQSFDLEFSKMQTLTEKLNLMTEYLKKLEVQIDADYLAAFKTGQELGLSIDRITDPQNTLQTLALTWKMLTVEERIQHFQSANQSLYELFNKKSDEDIQCLIDGNCTGLISKLVLKIGVYPEIEKYGVEKIKADLNQAAIGFLSGKINATAFEKIKELPETIKSRIRDSVEKNIGLVQDFKNKFKFNLAEGLQKKLKTESLGFYITSNAEVELQEQIALMSNDLYSIQGLDGSEKLVKQFGLIEKVISLVDFSNQQKKLLRNGLSNYLKNPTEIFLMSTLKNTTNTLLVKDQAAALKFLSLMVTATADWKSGPFDSGLTEIRAQDLISDFKSDQLNQSVFPKTELFNICFANAVKILKQIQSEKSLVYLVNNNNERVAISDYLSGKNHPTVALAAASDQKNNRSMNVTKVADLALMIDALSAFSQATKGIENSQSQILKDPEIKLQIENANKNIELLVLTLANFISSQMIGPKNLVDDAYDFETKSLSQNYQLSNQVAAISALIQAYETTGIHIYLLSAKELYYSTNRNYFDQQLKFYKNSLSETKTVEINKDDVLNSLNHLISIRKYLNLTSQVQFDRIFENWYVAILL